MWLPCGVSGQQQRRGEQCQTAPQKQKRWERTPLLQVQEQEQK